MQTKERTIARLEHWWLPKVGPALAVGYCAALVFRVPGWATMRSIAVIAFVGLCTGSYGFILNDIFDVEVDRRAGKPNRMAAFSPLQRFLLCALTLALGFAPSLIVPTSHRTLLMLGLEYVVLSVYSVPPIRLKARGILGLLCDACGSHVMANLYVLSVLADVRTVTARSTTAIAFVTLVCLWELCLGLIGIVVHQVEDRENDLRSGIRTFATSRSFASIRVPANLVFLGELLAFTCLCGVILRIAPLLSIAVLVYAVLLCLKLWIHWPHYRDLRKQTTLTEWWQFSHQFYEAYFPLATALQCAFLHPQLLAFVAVHLAVFVPAFRAQLTDADEGYRRLLLGGILEVASDCSARVHPVLFPVPNRRIDIAAGDPMMWKVRIKRPGVTVRSGQQYEIQLTMRADKPREIVVGVWQDHEPWKLAGFCGPVDLSHQWQRIQKLFTAAEDEPKSYLGIWLGGNPGSVELRHWSIRAVSPSIPHAEGETE